MDKRVLLTGATGFIGGHIARLLALKKTNYTVIVRPKTSPKKLANLVGCEKIVELDLANTEGLKRYLDNERFDVILHVGALRGGRKYPQAAYYDANVKATEQLAINALKNDSVMVFCSSVGVYGAIPQELPARVNTEFNDDNYYHYTKITAEYILGRYAIKGLRVTTLRPSITYGEGDYGFPYTLTKLVHRKLMLLPDKVVWIHLANIEIVADAFYKVAECDFRSNQVYNLADRYPVKLNELVDFISNRLGQGDYPDNRYLSRKLFSKVERFADRFGYDSLKNRIQLISKSWFYDTNDTFNDLYLRHSKTIPDFKVVVDWYIDQKKIKK